jgi:uncharacterized repeat protein (TIGR03847 family)
MPNEVIDLNPIEHITVDAIGDPEERTFLLQGQAGEQLVTLLLEQEQILALSIAGDELLDILEEQYSRELNQFQIPSPESMALQAPVEPLFQVAQFQLGYDAERDYLVIIAIELPTETEFDITNLAVVRFWFTREQMIALLSQIDEVISSGPTLCPACGEPMDPQSHTCIRNN